MIANLLRKFQHIYHAVVPFNKAKDKLLLMDFTTTNKTLTPKYLMIQKSSLRI
jgi:hypothetical protein